MAECGDCISCLAPKIESFFESRRVAKTQGGMIKDVRFDERFTSAQRAVIIQFLKHVVHNALDIQTRTGVGS